VTFSTNYATCRTSSSRQCKNLTRDQCHEFRVLQARLDRPLRQDHILLSSNYNHRISGEELS
jgi:hypothetical protein